MKGLGLISDTHGLLRPAAVAALRGATQIIHAGDVGSPDVLVGLSAIAPVIAVRGNVDEGSWADELPERASVTFEGLRIFVCHRVQDVTDADRRDHDVIIVGHSHKPIAVQEGRVLLVNPGSAGPRRFKLPVTVALVTVVDGAAQVDFRSLAPQE